MKLSHENIEKLLIDVALYVRATETYSASVGTDKNLHEAELLEIFVDGLRARQDSMGVYYARADKLDFWAGVARDVIERERVASV